MLDTCARPTVVCLLGTVCVISTAAADDAVPASTQPAASQPSAGYHLTTTDRLTGNWAGVRTSLSDAGISFNISLTSIYQHNVHGGLQTHNGHRITGSADYELIVDLEALGLLKGGTVYVLAESGWGNSISDDRIGSLLSTNGDAYLGDEEAVVSELWYEQVFLEEKARFRFGKLDLTLDFDTNAYANDETSQFMNDGLINLANSSIPDRGLGAQLIVEPVEWLYAGIGAADAQTEYATTGFSTTFHDEDYFYAIAEIGLMPVWKTPWGELPGAYRVGTWYDPQPKERFMPETRREPRIIRYRRDDVGFYTGLDQLLLKEVPDSAGDTQGLGMFFRYGWAQQSCNPIEHSWSVGGQYQGLFPHRDEDVLAFGFAQSIISDAQHAVDGSDRESVYELYYRIHVFPWLQITPDVQYISNPGALGGRDAVAVGVRIQAAF